MQAENTATVVVNCEPKPHGATCQACGQEGQRVKRVTLESLLRPERRGEIGEDQYYVCAKPSCDTVYYGACNGQTFRKPDLTVRFGLKETNAPRPVCYCFDHTVEDIHDEIQRTGRSTVVQSIKVDMKGPGCRCEYTNPLGECCLKTVQIAVADALPTHGNEERGVAGGAVDYSDCCGDNGHARKDEEVTADCGATQIEASEGAGAGSRRDRTGTLAAGGSVVAAILSSACCWLPLVMIAIGASAGGVAGFIEAYRPYFIVGAFGLLGLGFYMVYFRREQCEQGSACATPNRKLVRFNKVMLWTATALVGAFVMFPNYVGLVVGSPNNASAIVGVASLASAKYRIEGMTCEGCSSILHSALTKLPEVKAAEVDFATTSAVVYYEPGKSLRPGRVIEAVNAAGYSASLIGQES